MFNDAIHVTIVGNDWRIDSFSDGKHITMTFPEGLSDVHKDKVSRALIDCINAPGAVRTIEEDWKQ